MNKLATLYFALSDLAARIGKALDWLPPTVARLGLGWLFALSGWGKLHALDDVTTFFTTLGLPAPHFQATLVASTELVCGGLLLLGLATRFAAIPLMITMVVALVTALSDRIESPADLFGIAEALYIVLLGWLATRGPGPISLDHAIEVMRARRDQTSPVTRSASMSAIGRSLA